MKVMTGSRPVLLGGALVVGVIASLIVAVNAVNGLPWDRGELYSARLENANHLLAGAQVQVTGVHVGNVERVEIHPEGGARVWFRVRDLEEGAVRRDATVAVRPRSPLGQQLLILEPGSPDTPPLAARAEVPVEQTRYPTELDEILDVFDEETVADTRALLRATGGGLLGTGPDIDRLAAGAPELLEGLGETADVLVSREESVARMLRSGASLTSRLEDRDEAIASLLEDGGTTLAALGEGDGLERALAAAPAALDDGTGALRRLSEVLEPTGTALRDVQPGVASLSDSLPATRELLTEGTGTLDRLAVVAQDADEPIAALAPAVADLRPFLSQLDDTVTEAVPAVEYLAPYGPEIAKWFRLGSSVIGSGDSRSNWLRFLIQINEESVMNGLPTESPLVNSHPYPNPGEAPSMRDRYQPVPATEEQD